VNALLLRRAALFSAVAGLGLTLAWLLAGGGSRSRGPRSRLAVVEVPAGTDLHDATGIPGIRLVEATGIRVAPIQEIALEDGSRVPFRALVLRSGSQQPLPSGAAGVRRASLANPVLRMLPVPRTRAQLAASATAVPTSFSAPEGVLETGPGDAVRLELRGGVLVEAVQEGTPWTFKAERAFADLKDRSVRAPGAVSLSSGVVDAEGADLEVREEGRLLVLKGGAKGVVRKARGVRLGGAGVEGDTRFRCSGPFRLEGRAPAGGPAPERPERWRLVLEREAALEQDRGTLAADRIEGDLRRPRDGGKASLEELIATGSVALDGRGDEGTLRATGGRLIARPTKEGATEVSLEDRPAVRVRRGAEGPGERTVEAAGEGTAVVVLPAEEGPVTVHFRGGATAAVTDPAAKEGDPPRRRELRARTLRIAAHRDGDGTTEVKGIEARDLAELREGERRAKADRIQWLPREGGSGEGRALLEGNVSLSWPAAGVLDPLASGDGKAGAPAGDPGSLLLSSPGRLVLDLPPAEPASAGAVFTVEGGATVRRVAGEREVWRLTCAKCEGTLRPGTRELDALVASGEVRLAGREERAGGRSYDFRGETLEVRGSPGSREPRAALLRGLPGKPPSATFEGEDGRPFTVAAETLRLDRENGRLLAEESVRATGVLPERPSGGPAARGGRVDLACARLEARFAGGDAEGTTRLLGLEARGGVRLSAAGERLTGETLVHDAEKDTLELRGDPARVASRVEGPPGTPPLEDLCEADLLHLSFRDGRLLEARAPDGGLLVRHRARAAAPGEPAPRVERWVARAEGAVVHRPEETLFRGPVTFDHAALHLGDFRPRHRIEGADEVRVLHPAPEPGRPGRMERAFATSRGGRIEVSSDEDGWRATGVSSVEFDAPGNRLVLEAGQGLPRFRIDSKDGVSTGRRVVADLEARVFREWVGLGIEGER
jgi:hypothetical protein